MGKKGGKGLVIDMEVDCKGGRGRRFRVIFGMGNEFWGVVGV